MASLAAGSGFLGQLQDGDLVLFAAGRPILGLLRRICGPGWSHVWTHVGMVLREPGAAEPALWEAHPQRAAVRQIPLAARIAHFHGRVSARRLNRELGAAQRARLDAMRGELAARERRRDLLDLMSAGDDGWLGARTRNLGVLAAGELVAEAYQRLGLLEATARGGPPASDFRPRHFAEDAGLQLKQGFALGPELVLRAPDEVTRPAPPLAPQPA